MGRVIINPGAAILANVQTPLPTGTPIARSLFAAAILRLTEAAPNTYTRTVKTVVTAVPGAGEIRIIRSSQKWELGDAVAATDMLELDLEEEGQFIRSP